MNCHREEIHSAKKHKIDRFINYILSYILRIFTCRDLSHLAASLHPRQSEYRRQNPQTHRDSTHAPEQSRAHRRDSWKYKSTIVTKVNITAKKILELIGIVRMRQNKAEPIEGIAENWKENN